MKKLILIFLAFVLVMTGCSSGVSQAEYDAVVAERDEALAQVEILKEQLNTLEQAQTIETVSEEDITEETEPVETTPPEENIADLLEIETVKWHKHYINADDYHCDLIVTNNSHQRVRASFSIKYFDESNNIIGIDDASTEALGPGETHLIIAENESPYDHAEVTVANAKAEDRYIGSLENVSCNDYLVNGEKVIFEVTNNGDAAIEFVKADVLFYNGTDVVDHDYAYAIDDDNELKPGATLMDEVSTNKSFTSYRIFYYGRIDG